jgi:hypothetical protein
MGFGISLEPYSFLFEIAEVRSPNLAALHLLTAPLQSKITCWLPWH